MLVIRKILYLLICVCTVQGAMEDSKEFLAEQIITESKQRKITVKEIVQEKISTINKSMEYNDYVAKAEQIAELFQIDLPEIQALAKDEKFNQSVVESIMGKQYQSYTWPRIPVALALGTPASQKWMAQQIKDPLIKKEAIELFIRKTHSDTNLKKIKMLLAAGISADENQFLLGHTALTRAAWLGAPQMVKVLIQANADILRATQDGKTAWQVAIESIGFSPIYKNTLTTQLSIINLLLVETAVKEPGSYLSVLPRDLCFFMSAYGDFYKIWHPIYKSYFKKDFKNAQIVE